MALVKETNVSYRRTVSRNYQSATHEFGFNVSTATSNSGGMVARANVLCMAVVHHRLDVKIGMTRRELDQLAAEFFGTSWQELSTGVAEGNEVI